MRRPEGRAVLALLLSAASALGGPSPPPPDATLRVLNGAAFLATGPTIRRIAPGDGYVRLALDGEAVYVELPAGAELELARAGAYGAVLAGPARLEVRDPAPEDAVAVTLIVGDLHRLELEVRSQPLLLVAADQGWSLAVQEAALRLEGLASRGLRVSHHGGEPVRVFSLAGRRPGRWPCRLRGGDRTVLPPPAPDQASAAPSPWM